MLIDFSSSYRIAMKIEGSRQNDANVHDIDMKQNT